jgi:hypothetical protein
MVTDRRGQVFTLEAVVAALLIVSSVAFALSVTAATPLSGSASNRNVENQQAAFGAGLLDTARATDDLRSTLLYWDDTDGGFHDAGPKGYYLSCSFDTPLGDLLERSLEDNGIACIASLGYRSETGERRSERLVYLGEPTDNAVAVRTSVALYDDDVLLDAAGNPTGVTLAEATTFYAPDAAPGDPLYNVVEVEVILWRM